MCSFVIYAFINYLYISSHILRIIYSVSRVDWNAVLGVLTIYKNLGPLEKLIFFATTWSQIESIGMKGLSGEFYKTLTEKYKSDRGSKEITICVRNEIEEVDPAA